MEEQISFNDLIQGDQLVLVDFYADWCGPCKAMNPILQEVAEAVGDKAIIIKIDVDKNRPIAEQYVIHSIPTLILFQAGNVLWKCAGMQSAYHLKQLITDFYQLDLKQDKDIKYGRIT